MKKKLFETTKEALTSVLPITVIVYILTVVISPMSVGTLGLFLFGALFLIVGMGIFTTGVDMALIPLGEGMGIQLTKTKQIAIIVIINFIMGTIITIAEPDLQVLAQLVPGIQNMIIVLTVAVGVGVFLVISVIRILFRVSLSKILVISYALLIILSIFVPNNFVPVAFDSGGVTTGPITVPFIMAMGVGFAALRGDKGSVDDSFGFIGICSIGPILAVMILGICFQPESTEYIAPVIPIVETSRDITFEYLRHIPEYFVEVFQSVWPIVAVLAVMQLLTRRYRKMQLLRMLVGFVYTFIGLAIFLTGVNVGFIPAGHTLGANIAASQFKWLLIPIGALIGYFIVAAEPSVHVLKKQVEEVSGEAIPGSAVQAYLSVGVSFSLAIAMLRVLTGISIYWFVIPGYTLAIILSFFVPKIFVGIAFDSGGVASGPMTSTFLLPLVIGACVNPDRIMTDAFGIVAMVAMTPIIAILIMGTVYKKKMLSIKSETDEAAAILEEDDIDIIDLLDETDKRR